MYRRRLVDRGIVRDYFGGSAIAYWQWAQWFIVHQRAKLHSDELMEELEDMCSRINRGQQAKVQRMTFPYGRQRRKRVDRRRQTAQPTGELNEWLERLVSADRNKQDRMLAELSAGSTTLH
jgi:hypothetical protein